MSATPKIDNNRCSSALQPSGSSHFIPSVRYLPLGRWECVWGGQKTNEGKWLREGFVWGMMCASLWPREINRDLAQAGRTGALTADWLLWLWQTCRSLPLLAACRNCTYECVCVRGSRQTEASRGGRLQLQPNERTALTHRRTHLNPGTQEEEEEEGESEGETLSEAARESEGVREGETGRVWGRTPWLQIRGWLLCFCGLYPSRLWARREPTATKVRLQGGELHQLTHTRMCLQGSVHEAKVCWKVLFGFHDWDWVGSSLCIEGDLHPKVIGGDVDPWGQIWICHLHLFIKWCRTVVTPSPTDPNTPHPHPHSRSLCVPPVFMWGRVSVTAEQPPLLQPWQELLNQKRMWEGQGASPVQGWGRLCFKSERPKESLGRLRSHRAGSERRAARKTAIWMSDFISLSRSVKEEVSPSTSSFCFSGFCPLDSCLRCLLLLQFGSLLINKHHNSQYQNLISEKEMREIHF